MPASITDKFTKVGTGTVTSLASPGKAIAATSINIGSATNYPTDTAVYFAIRIVDPALISFSSTNYNPSGVVPGTYTVWKGTVSGTVISNLQLQAGGAANQVYPAGTNTQVFIDLSSAQMNSLIDGLMAEHNQNGTHSAVTATSITTTGPVTVAGALTASGTISGITPAKFQNPYKFSVYRAAALNTVNGQLTVLFDTTEYDTGTNYNAANGRFTAPVAGFYSFQAFISVNTGGPQLNDIYLTKNGLKIKQGNQVTFSANAAGLVVAPPPLQLAANDYINVVIGSSAVAGLTVGQANCYYGGFMVSAT